MKSIVLCDQRNEVRSLIINDPITAGNGVLRFPRDVVIRSIVFGGKITDDNGSYIPHYIYIDFTSFSNIVGAPAGSVVNPILSRVELATDDTNSFKDIYVELTGSRELYFGVDFIPLVDRTVDPFDFVYTCVINYEELEFNRGRFVDNKPEVSKFKVNDYEQHY